VEERSVLNQGTERREATFLLLEAWDLPELAAHYFYLLEAVQAVDREISRSLVE
jgi:hypothetical protein